MLNAIYENVAYSLPNSYSSLSIKNKYTWNCKEICGLAESKNCGLVRNCINLMGKENIWLEN